MSRLSTSLASTSPLLLTQPRLRALPRPFRRSLLTSLQPSTRTPNGVSSYDSAMFAFRRKKHKNADWFEPHWEETLPVAEANRIALVAYKLKVAP